MFTGIIKELGIVRGISKGWGGYRLDIESKDIFKTVAIGDSVSVNGVCLTVVERKKNVLSFDIMDETARGTTLTGLKDNDAVNMEAALRTGDMLGGHFILGHVDCVGKIKAIQRSGDDISFEIESPEEFDSLLVTKGSVAIDGISLTVGGARSGLFSVHLIPHTMRTTNLAFRRKGDKVNIEFDIVGKYVAKIEGRRNKGGLNEEFLKGKGFM